MLNTYYLKELLMNMVLFLGGVSVGIIVGILLIGYLSIYLGGKYKNENNIDSGER